MKKIVRLTESELTRIVRRVIKESNIWSDEEVSDFMNDVLRTELGKDIDFNSMDEDKQIRFVSNYSRATADEDVAHNLKKWALNKINSKDLESELGEGKIWDAVKKPFKKIGNSIKNTIQREILHGELEEWMENYILKKIEEINPELDSYNYSTQIEPPYVIVTIDNKNKYEYNSTTGEIRNIR